ncbi:MAG TPA: aspartate kinase [Gaiellaceae bacterium]|nr:aspartate kinase [Gaiellaceae bacterium]
MATAEYESLPQVSTDAVKSGRDVAVMKFGGTSVGDTEKIREVARRLVRAREEGRRVVGVLSAMGDTTDELIRLAYEISPQPHPREYDMLISVGERISNALCAMAVHDLGHEAISLTGSQAGIVTDTVHGKAKIAEVRATRINDALDAGKIVLVAGFQGVSADSHDVTTLGRGGSDTTAVALAAALGADVCEIYTDVEGVFTADPRIVRDALKLGTVSYEEMLEMAATGARVMMARSVEIARRYGVRLHVRAAAGDSEGTWVAEEGDLVLEKAIVSGVTHDVSEAKATIVAVPDTPGVAARVFRVLADAGVNIDMIVQNVSAEGTTDISFTLPKSDLPTARPILDQLAADIGARASELDDDIAKVSLVGAGMKSHPGVAADMFEALAGAGINIEIISTSSIRVSCVVRAADVERAVQAVHDKFRLYAEERANA